MDDMEKMAIMVAVIVVCAILLPNLRKIKSIENKNIKDVDAPKQRHGFVTAWLVIGIVLNSITAVMYISASESVMGALPNVSPEIFILLGVCGIANIIFTVMLFQWKKLGFWGLVVSSVVVLIINLIIGIEIIQLVPGLIGVVVLYGVLQIKKDGVTAWENLE
jgi:hypothetical protein